MKSMKKRLFGTISLFIIIAILSTAITAEIIHYYSLLSTMQAEVKNEAGILAGIVNMEGDRYLTEQTEDLTNSRITLIDTDGVVLYDSYETDLSVLSNHASRSEVASAMKNGVGESTRHSETLGKTTYYYAIRLSSGQVIRVSGTIDSVFSAFAGEFSWIFLFIAVLLVLSLFAADRLTRKIVQPINELDIEHPLCNNLYEEMQPLLRRVDEQNRTIRKQMDDISRSREEYMSVTENMQDGLIITNTKSILSINRAAMHFFHVELKDVEGRNIMTVTQEPEVQEAWDKAVAGEHFDGLFDMDGKTYEILGNPVLIDQKIHGAVLMILDITEKEHTEAMRREFTANVSHELKTPLMSISGYAELIENGMALPKDIPEFAGKIRGEAARMTSLVGDIIKLSELDERKDAGDETVDLYEVAKEAAENLNFTARRMKVTLTVSGHPETLTGSRSLIYEMIRNLLDNGIKYNRTGGAVDITVGETDGHPFLSVKDNGIGIPAEDTDRIFERFYRVDKSHSRASGGTGLGLSIVKHAALLHKGKISVDSRIGYGTTITIIF